MTFPSVDGHCPVHHRPEQNKKVRKTEFALEPQSSPALDVPGSLGYRPRVVLHHYVSGFQAFEWYPQASGSPVCCWQIVKLLSLHNSVSQSCMLNLFLLVLFLCAS